jgi:phosphoribosyl-AMP cyclohydrolase
VGDADAVTGTSDGTGRRAGRVVWQDSRVPDDTTRPAPVTDLAPDVASRLKRDDAGLVAAIVQQHDTGEVLMLGWMDDEALHRTLTTGRVTFWSRSRREYWRKGDTSGHVQVVRSVALDCDGDALLVRVHQVGAACHTGTRTCFEAGGDLGAVVGDVPGPASGSAGTATPPDPEEEDQ